MEVRTVKGIPLSKLEKAVSPYADDVAVMVLDASEVETVDSIVKEHESVAGVIINADKSVGLRLCIWRGRSMSSDIGLTDQ